MKSRALRGGCYSMPGGGVATLLHLLGGDVATFLHLIGLGVAVYTTVLQHNVMLGCGVATLLHQSC